MEPRVIPISSRSSSARARVWSLQPDAVLCSAASHGNELAFNELFRRHHPSLRAFVFHLLGARHRHEDSEDVVQDAFARAFDAISEQRFSGDFRRWIFTIARNRSIDLLRGERIRLVSLETAGVDSGPQATAEATMPAVMAETRDELAWLVAAIDQLPERQRSALLLRELAGLSHSEIAETLDTTAGSARQLITRARDGVRSAAERDGREHETRKSKSLRRELLDATPMLPLAAAGVVASAGTTAGGSIALGKIVATVLASMVLAGSTGQVARDAANANTAPTSPSAPEQSLARESVGSTNSDRGRFGAENRDDSNPRSRSELVDDAKPEPRTESHASPDDSRQQEVQPNAIGHDAAIKTKTVAEAPAGAAPEVPEPVKEIVELPGKVVEQVTETLGEVTTGLIGPDSR